MARVTRAGGSRGRFPSELAKNRPGLNRRPLSARRKRPSAHGAPERAVQFTATGKSAGKQSASLVDGEHLPRASRSRPGSKRGGRYIPHLGDRYPLLLLVGGAFLAAARRPSEARITDIVQSFVSCAISLANLGIYRVFLAECAF